MTRRGFSEQAFLIMSALAAGPLHGYALLSEVADLSGGRIRLRVGTLYGIVDRLAEDEVIEVDHEEIIDSRLRRYYRLSTNGRRVLADEAARQAANAQIAVGRLAAAKRSTRPARNESGLRSTLVRNDPRAGEAPVLAWSPTI
ncbi:MAG: helix-turn-helix transcriptional regulator [Actinobacteria bacterium]|nr:helix-turn-helix transcriptional regulator [Actinomycetota bacterium]